jgi:hypothetical protein
MVGVPCTSLILWRQEDEYQQYFRLNPTTSDTVNDQGAAKAG